MQLGLSGPTVTNVIKIGTGNLHSRPSTLRPNCEWLFAPEGSNFVVSASPRKSQNLCNLVLGFQLSHRQQGSSFCELLRFFGSSPSFGLKRGRTETQDCWVVGNKVAWTELTIWTNWKVLWWKQLWNETKVLSNAALGWERRIKAREGLGEVEEVKR